MQDEYKYFFFPVFLLKDLTLGNKEAFEDIFSIGIYRVAKKVTFDYIDTAYKQVMYAYYRSPDQLQPELKRLLDELVEDGWLTLDEDYNGFDTFGSSFDPVMEVTDLIKAADSYPDLQEMCTEFYEIHVAKEALQLQFNIGHYIKQAKRVQGRIDQYEENFGVDASASIKTDMLIRFYSEEITQFDLDLFKAYASIKSILGAKKLFPFIKEKIAQRMVGAKSNKVLAELLKDDQVRVLYERYSNRYWMDKILDQLEDRKFIVKLAYARRVYISTTHSKENIVPAIAKYLEATKKASKTAQRKKGDALLRKQLEELLKG